ncbi:hypothetical protein BDP27DRAFT_1378770 [Rhodocollybia butyracea]|uniref:Uncharacterized protein n=1 Tax=Rhodocollybia butyracea TaxID=206335 RepID=A0A9P5P3X8_9AGAR|nr:hypothetical protein BDP27DRAFT_1378770 [Rhodocollybia butyracea]
MFHSALVRWLVALLAFLSSFSNSMPQPDPLQIHTIRNAYQELGERVTQAIRIQLGDLSQIHRQQVSAEAFLISVNEHQHLFDQDELTTMQTSIQNMLSALEDVAKRSQDIIEHAPIVPVELSRSGRRGRPRKEINSNILETGLQLRGVTHLAPVFDCSPRTIRRRALEHGLVQPSPQYM